MTSIAADGATGSGRTTQTISSSKSNINIVDVPDVERESEGHRTRGGSIKHVTLRD